MKVTSAIAQDRPVVFNVILEPRTAHSSGKSCANGHQLVMHFMSHVCVRRFLLIVDGHCRNSRVGLDMSAEQMFA